MYILPMGLKNSKGKWTIRTLCLVFLCSFVLFILICILNVSLFFESAPIKTMIQLPVNYFIDTQIKQKKKNKYSPTELSKYASSHYISPPTKKHAIFSKCLCHNFQYWSMKFREIELLNTTHFVSQSSYLRCY